VTRRSVNLTTVAEAETGWPNLEKGVGFQPGTHGSTRVELMSARACFSSGIAVFSLLAYFAWREGHRMMQGGFIGLATGYVLAPLLTRLLRHFGKY
jgi:hypothetical protein